MYRPHLLQEWQQEDARSRMTADCRHSPIASMEAAAGARFCFW